MDAIQVAIDYCAEEGFYHWVDPEKRAWVEVHHPRGGARVYQDGQVESALNSKLKEVLEKKLALARAKDAEDADLQGYVSLDLYTMIRGRLEDLTNDHLAKLVADIHELQMDREGEHSAFLVGRSTTSPGRAKPGRI